MIVASALEAAGHYAESLRAFTLAAEQYADLPEAQTAMLRAAQICTRYLNDPDQAQISSTTCSNGIRIPPGRTWRRNVCEKLDGKPSPHRPINSHLYGVSNKQNRPPRE